MQLRVSFGNQRVVPLVVGGFVGTSLVEMAVVKAGSLPWGGGILAYCDSREKRRRVMPGEVILRSCVLWGEGLTGCIVV